MLESKRFYCKKDGVNEWVVSDRLNQFPMPVFSLEFCIVVADALNSLWGEIVRLEKHSQELVQRSIKYEDTIDELKNENEQLKKDKDFFHDSASHMSEKIDELIHENEQFHNIARDYNIPFNILCETFEEVLEENEELKSLLNEISDENDRILLNDGRIIQLRKVFKGEWK